jgi:hypothetical protein
LWLHDVDYHWPSGYEGILELLQDRTLLTEISYCDAWSNYVIAANNPLPTAPTYTGDRFDDLACGGQTSAPTMWIQIIGYSIDDGGNEPRGGEHWQVKHPNSAWANGEFGKVQMQRYDSPGIMRI